MIASTIEPPSSVPIVEWPIDQAEVARTDQMRAEFGLMIPCARPYFSPSAKGMAWAIVSTGWERCEVRGYPPSLDYNPSIVGFVLEEQDRLLLEFGRLGSEDPGRREAVLGQVLFYSTALIIAGLDLLHCEADAATTNLLLHELQASAAAIESGRSCSEWELDRLREVLLDADCGKRSKAA